MGLWRGGNAVLSAVFRPAGSGDVLGAGEQAAEGNRQLLLLHADDLKVKQQEAGVS